MKLLSSPLLLVLLACLFPAPSFCPGAAPTSAPSPRPAGPPFENEIKTFEAADAKHAPPKDAVLFVGSSSIRKWTTVAADFPDLKVINRGFGGSTIPDNIRYAPRIVTPYKPKAIVFYAGDNDINAGHKPEQVLADFKAFVSAVRKDLPQTPILFISIKPSVARVKQLAKQTEANRLVKDYIATDKTLTYVDVATPMLGPDGQPRKELFVSDNLHMNAEGYKLWTSILTPILKKVVAEQPEKSTKP